MAAVEPGRMASPTGGEQGQRVQQCKQCGVGWPWAHFEPNEDGSRDYAQEVCTRCIDPEDEERRWQLALCVMEEHINNARSKEGLAIKPRVHPQPAPRRKPNPVVPLHPIFTGSQGWSSPAPAVSPAISNASVPAGGLPSAQSGSSRTIHSGPSTDTSAGTVTGEPKAAYKRLKFISVQQKQEPGIIELPSNSISPAPTTDAKPPPPYSFPTETLPPPPPPLPAPPAHQYPAAPARPVPGPAQTPHIPSQAVQPAQARPPAQAPRPAGIVPDEDIAGMPEPDRAATWLRRYYRTGTQNNPTQLSVWQRYFQTFEFHSAQARGRPFPLQGAEFVCVVQRTFSNVHLVPEVFTFGGIEEIQRPGTGWGRIVGIGAGL